MAVTEEAHFQEGCSQNKSLGAYQDKTGERT